MAVFGMKIGVAWMRTSARRIVGEGAARESGGGDVGDGAEPAGDCECGGAVRRAGWEGAFGYLGVCGWGWSWRGPADLGAGGEGGDGFPGGAASAWGGFADAARRF